jgi:hypothetical protein
VHGQPVWHGEIGKSEFRQRSDDPRRQGVTVAIQEGHPSAGHHQRRPTGVRAVSLWEHLLHNQTALQLKAALLFHPGVVVARPQCEPQTNLVDYQIGERWARTSTGKGPKESVT